MPVSPPIPAELSTADRHRLGEALSERAAHVLEETIVRTVGSGEVVDALVQSSFERICASSTNAVARWIAGDGLEAPLEAGRETSRIFGELAAHRAASLHEVMRRCFTWRDVMAEVLRESAMRLSASPRALEEATSMLQQSLEFSLIRMCEAFEHERIRAEEELARRIRAEQQLARREQPGVRTSAPRRLAPAQPR